MEEIIQRKEKCEQDIVRLKAGDDSGIIMVSSSPNIVRGERRIQMLLAQKQQELAQIQDEALEWQRATGSNTKQK